VSLTSEAVTRDYALWGTAGNYAQQISNMKTWLSERVSYITTNLGPFSACQQVNVPPLVITKIMYHPDTTATIARKDLEFIEVTNAGDQSVNLTGVYFSGTGLVYQFPSGAILGPQGSWLIASNKTAFQTHYGATAMESSPGICPTKVSVWFLPMDSGMLLIMCITTTQFPGPM